MIDMYISQMRKYIYMCGYRVRGHFSISGTGSEAATLISFVSSYLEVHGSYRNRPIIGYYTIYIEITPYRTIKQY